MPKSHVRVFSSLKPFAALTAGILVGAVLSSFSAHAGGSGFGGGPRPVHSNARFGAHDIVLTNNNEASPEDLAKELGLPQTDDEPFQEGNGISKSVPQTRVVAPEHFKDFRVNVDIFRRSVKRPVLGEFRDEYTAVLVPDAAAMTPEARTAEAKERFENLAGREFAIASLDGVPFKAYIISGAIEQKVSVAVKDAEGNVMKDPTTGAKMTRLSMKSTPPGNYRLDALAYDKKFKQPDGKFVTAPVAFPWVRSEAYHNSQMYWALWIKGGYFIHSTPHYGELGRPASMGCIRQSFPDAQELFKLMVEQNMTGMIRIHAIGSNEAVNRLQEVSLAPSKDINWVLGQLQSNYENIRASIKYYDTTELNIAGDSWLDEVTSKPAATTWPTCGDVNGNPIDCFKTWGVRKPKNSTN
jgi:hypothetical protein